MIKLLIRFALWRAGVHTRRSAFWHDVAEALLTGESIATIRARRRKQDEEGEGQ